MKKLAVVACGWHYSSHFYETMIKQKVPKGWKIEYFDGGGGNGYLTKIHDCYLETINVTYGGDNQIFHEHNAET